MRPRSQTITVTDILLLALVGGGLAWLVQTTQGNLATRQIGSGFAYLEAEAGFAISESVIAYDESNSYGRALLVGVLNTLKVSVVGVILSTVLGVLFGVARLSPNRILAGVAGAYIEAVRNVPLLLQLFFWYGVMLALPHPREALQPLSHIYLTNRGLYFPEITSLFPLALDVPQAGRFNITGGLVLSPEFTALLAGLTLYTTAFIAEIVRGGIQTLARGQREAARALGLSPLQALRYVLLPQALRVIIPPVTNQYLNLIKNSSLAVAIGYPDLVSVANTTLNQTGQALENIAIIMSVYLGINLCVSLLMNGYNKAVAYD